MDEMTRWLKAVCSSDLFRHDSVQITVHFLENGRLTKHLREGFYRVKLRRVRSCLKESKQTSAYRARHRLRHNPHNNRGNTIFFLPFLASGALVLKQFQPVDHVLHRISQQFITGGGWAWLSLSSPSLLCHMACFVDLRDYL